MDTVPLNKREMFAVECQFAIHMKKAHRVAFIRYFRAEWRNRKLKTEINRH